MRAIVAEQFGAPEVLKMKDVPKPVPGVGEVLVKVAAASVNPLDIQIRRGDYADYVQSPFQMGVDISGTVEAVGDGLEGFAAGDDVFYSARVLENEGGYAEYHIEKAEIVAKKPKSLSHVEAASMPIAASTAWVCLIERGRLTAGDRVLILGGSGGVGLYAVQIAKLADAHVVATCRDDAQDLVRDLGADITVDYKSLNTWEKLADQGDGGFDVIVDLIGGDAIEQSVKLLATGGRVVSIVDQPQPQSLYAGWEFNAEIHLVFLSPNAERLSRLGALAEKGQLKPIVEKTLPLEQAAEAHRLIEAGGRKGKIVLVTS